MRTIKQTVQFKRDLKREAKGKYRKTLEEDLLYVISSLAADKQLESKYRDHALKGNKRDFRDCHIKPDLILLYKKTEDNVLFLIRLGSHSELNI